MKTLIATTWVLAMAMTAASTSVPADPVVILSPPAYSSTVADRVYLVGKTSAPIVEVYLNDQKYCELFVSDSMFHTRVLYGYGLNEIRVRPVYSGVVETEDHSVLLEVLCGPYTSRKLERIYQRYDFHLSDQADLCISCHQGERDQQHPARSISFCTSCHVEFKGRSDKHAQLGDKDCVICHNAEEKESLSRMSAATIHKACLGCHADKIEKFDREYIHGPVAGGSCVVCHDPHGSEYDHSLISAEQILCYSCHDFTDEIAQATVLHPPFEKGDCTACHDPHATSNKWVLIKSSETVCLKCHDPDQEGLRDHAHPYNVKPQRKLAQDLKLSSRGRLECISCHDPHTAQVVHLLRSNQANTCLGCHGDKI